jgi:MFS family permease
MPACSTPSPGLRFTLRMQAALVAAQFLALGLLMGSWATGLPSLKARFGYSAQELSGVLLAVAAGSVLAFLSCARLMQAVGPRHFIRATGPLAAYAMVTTLLVADSLPLAVIAFVFGWASAAFDVAINGSAVTLERLHGRSLMSKLHAMFSSGGMLAAGATAGLAWRGLHPLWLALPVALLMTALSLYTPAMPALAEPPARAGSAVPPPARPWRLGFAALLCLLCEGTMYDWSSVYMTQVWQAPLFLSVAGFGLFSAAMAAGRFGGDALRDRFGASLLLLGGCTIAAAGALLCVWAHTRELALLGFVLVGLGLSNVIPIVFALAPAAHAQAPERAIAFVSGTGFIGFLVGPPLIGLWTLLASFDSSLLLVCAAALGTAVLAGRR